MPEPTPQEKRIYGADAKLDEIGGFPIEQGSGALPLAQQRENFCAGLPQPRADDMRRKMGLPVPSEIAAAAERKVAAENAHREAAEAALAAQGELESKVATLQAANEALAAENQSLTAKLAQAENALQPATGAPFHA